MPRSRNRTSRNRSSRQRRHDRQRRARSDRSLVATVRPGQSLEPLLTAEDRRIMHEALDAEARGDARSAFDLHMSGLIVEEALTHHCLREMAVLGDEAPAWMCGCGT